ncbi:MAG: NAD(P)H-hydrate dehydratase [Actinomycetota bacterium]
MGKIDGCAMNQSGGNTPTWHAWSASDCRSYVHLPRQSDDKYSRGVLGVIAGSRQYPGAALLVCKAALHTGIGMVRYSGPRTVKNILLQAAPEVVVQNGKVQSWVVGPGIDLSRTGRWRKRDINRALLEGVPTLIDAGALSELTSSTFPRIITPHFRELSRALSTQNIQVSPAEIESDPKKWAIRASEIFTCVVLLKGSHTVIASSEKCFVLPQSTSWLATAGSGDVLAGIIGALLATNSSLLLVQPERLSEIAATGAYIHAEAARVASNGGPISPTDIIDSIPEIVASLVGNSE